MTFCAPEEPLVYDPIQLASGTNGLRCVRSKSYTGWVNIGSTGGSVVQ
jgi:hypothetical protein